ncbi:MAG: TIGR02996 domain-containing protein [Gemmataceae bacterium]
MTRDDEAFLAAILAHPDDDLPRLVYADWLDDRGDPRGEFIRLEIELERDLLRYDAAAKARLARIHELLESNGDVWFANVAGVASDFSHWRGFVDTITLESSAFLRHGADILDRDPIRQVRLSGAWEDAERLAESPLLGRVRELSLRENYLRNLEATIILESPHLHDLLWLDLAGNRFDYRAIEIAAGCRHLASLKTLILSHNNVGSNGTAALARSEALRRLTSLSLSHAHVGPVGIDALTYQSMLEGLTDLDLSGNPIGGRGVRALANKPIRGLTKLRLSRVEMSPVWRERIAAQYPPGVVEF